MAFKTANPTPDGPGVCNVCKMFLPVSSIKAMRTGAMTGDEYDILKLLLKGLGNAFMFICCGYGW